MALTVLNVASPLAPVGPDAVGGAEQVLSHLDRALVERGHRSIVVACEGSVTAGLLVPLARPAGELTVARQWRAQAETLAAIERVLEGERVDLVHMHGVDFDRYLPLSRVPVLATLHLPPSWYSPEVFHLRRPGTWLHCVSGSQQQGCPSSLSLLSAVENGVPFDPERPCHARRRYVLSLGRICPEKGFHLALDAAKLAGRPMLLAGQVFAYPDHEKYFEEQIVPRLDRERRFLGPVGGVRKRRLLYGAFCLLVPSQVPETSSLVAMEALACGTPVVAFPSGALTEIVEHGTTGFLVESTEEMALAMDAARFLDPEACREAARRRFSLQRMIERYLQTYYTALVAPFREAVPC